MLDAFERNANGSSRMRSGESGASWVNEVRTLHLVSRRMWNRLELGDTRSELWRICGSYDKRGPVTKCSSCRYLIHSWMGLDELGLSLSLDRNCWMGLNAASLMLMWGRWVRRKPGSLLALCKRERRCPNRDRSTLSRSG